MRSDLAQGSEHRQGLRIPPHLAQASPAPVVVDPGLEAMLETLGRGGLELHGHGLAPLGGQIKALLLAAMQQQGAHQPLQFLQLAGPLGLPEATTALLAPMALAVALFKGPLIAPERMADRRQQRKQLGGAAIFHRCAAQQPDGPQARMAGQPQEGLGTDGAEGLGEVGLIDEQHTARLGQLRRQPRPAVQLQQQPQGGGLLAPVMMQAGRGQHHQTAIGQPNHGPGGRQGREGLAEAHRIGEQSAAPGQQPAGRHPLMGKQLATIDQGLIQGGGSHQLAMGRQRWQGLA